MNETMNDENIDISSEILVLKLNQHNLASSMSLLWSELLRTTSDPITRRMCNTRIKELNQYVLTATQV